MTTEDELLTALLAVPSDETRRSAYAHWLSARGDPRGEYLYRESAWAATRLDQAAARALETAAALDPVWVARVSRPPLGVFRTRMTLSHSGPRLCEDDLYWFERRFDCRLPNDYRAFLLNDNGGWPESGQFPLPQGRPGPAAAVVAYLCQIKAAQEPEIDLDIDLVWRGKLLEMVRRDDFGGQDEGTRWRRFPYRDWIIIGATVPADELEWICLGVRGETFGQVHLATTYLDSLVREERLCVAPTFAAFLALLESGR